MAYNGICKLNFLIPCGKIIFHTYYNLYNVYIMYINKQCT